MPPDLNPMASLIIELYNPYALKKQKKVMSN